LYKVCEILLVLLQDPRSFSFPFRPCVSRLLAGQKRGLSLKIASVLVDHAAPKGWRCKRGAVDAVQLVAVFFNALFILA
jgi:hypothetical protein